MTRSRRWALPAAALAAAAIVAVAVVSVGKQLRSGNDFPIYWNAARSLVTGGTPYDVTSGLHGYVYPPFLALVLVPLAFLPLAAAASIWFVLNLGAAVVACRTALALVRRAWGPRAMRGWALAAWFPLAGFFADNAALGQANVILLALSLAATAELLSGRDVRAGGLIGLAAAVKPHLALLAVPGLVRGRWRIGAGLFAALLVVGALLPAVTLGPARTASLGADWYRKVIVPAREGTLQGSKIWDQSPQAALRRLLVDAPAFSGTSVHLVSLDVRTYVQVSRVWTGLVGVLLLLLWALAPARRSERALLLDQALAYCGTLLLVGYILKAHFVALLLPLAAAAALARDGKWGTPLTVLAGVLIVLCNPGLAGRAVSNWSLAYSGVTLATLLLTGFLVVRRLRCRTA